MVNNFLKIATIFYFLSLGNLLAADQGFRYGISTFGDLKYPANFTHFDYVNPDAPKGGEIKYGAEGTFNSLNPFILKGISAAGIEMIFDSLMEGSADEISAKYGLIASGAKVGPDNKNITFKLRKIARFHDGSKITADDVVFSFNTLMSDGHPSYQMIYRDVKKVQKINNYEVKFIFRNNHNRDLVTSVASLPVFSKQYYTNVKFNKTTNTSPLGSGPYKVRAVDSGRTIIYERVKDYWAKDLPVNKGRYNFDQITYDYYRDNNILLEAFKSGSYDFRQENISRNWATAYDIEKVRNGEIIKKEVPHGLPTGMQAFVYNLRKDKFKNARFREALSYAFDFEWVRKKIFYNSYARTNSYFSNSEFASSGLITEDQKRILWPFRAQIPSRVFTDEFKMPQTDGSGYSRSNLLKAREILEEQGYFIENEKLIDPISKNPVEIEFLINGKAFQMVISPMVKNLAKLGIKAKVRLVDDNQYQIRLNKFDYDIVVNVFGQNLIPANEQFAYWHSSQKDVEGSRNLAGADNKVMDELIERITAATSKKELKTLTKSLDRVLLWNFYTIPQWHNKTYRILYKNKFEMPKTTPLYAIGLDSWWSNTNPSK